MAAYNIASKPAPCTLLPALGTGNDLTGHTVCVPRSEPRIVSISRLAGAELV